MRSPSCLSVYQYVPVHLFVNLPLIFYGYEAYASPCLELQFYSLIHIQDTVRS
jgi:hypothetical protein